MREIGLDKGLHCMVDDEDFHWLSRFKWYAHLSPIGTYYATAGTTLRMHRLVIGCASNQRVDHVNRNTLDNRKQNLRIATSAQNQMNSVLRIDSSTGFKGVTVNGRMFIARITVDGERIQVGRFLTSREAGLAYDWAARKHFGEFARLNLPDDDYFPSCCTKCGQAIMIEDQNDIELCSSCKIMASVLK